MELKGEREDERSFIWIAMSKVALRSLRVCNLADRVEKRW